MNMAACVLSLKFDQIRLLQSGRIIGTMWDLPPSSLTFKIYLLYATDLKNEGIHQHVAHTFITKRQSSSLPWNWCTDMMYTFVVTKISSYLRYLLWRLIVNIGQIHIFCSTVSGEEVFENTASSSSSSISTWNTYKMYSRGFHTHKKTFSQH